MDTLLTDTEKNEISVLHKMVLEKKVILANIVYKLELMQAEINELQKLRVETINQVHQSSSVINQKSNQIAEAHGISKFDIEHNVYYINTELMELVKTKQ